MTKRSATPGAPPSPNQQKVLDELRRMEVIREQRFYIGVSIKSLTDRLDRERIGGGMMPPIPNHDRQHEDGWVPWAASTVRDHLNDLEGKGHVVKTIVDGTAYYKPKEVK